MDLIRDTSFEGLRRSQALVVVIVKLPSGPGYSHNLHAQVVFCMKTFSNSSEEKKNRYGVYAFMNNRTSSQSPKYLRPRVGVIL